MSVIASKPGRAIVPLLLLAAPGHARPAAAPRWTPATSIDFSSHHDVLIRNDDGTTTPMDVPYHRAKAIGPGVWQIESDGDYSYLIEGEREALAIDSGYGAGNLREYLQTLTRKPVRHVANTHFHFDHTANDAYFDGAFMSAETAARATIPFPSFAGIVFPRDYPKTIVTTGYRIHLGDRDVEAIVIGNHTPGGTAFLDRKSRILFSGDEVMGRNEPLNISVAQFARNMALLETHRRAFDRLAGGPGLFDASYVDRYLAAARAVLAGKPGLVPASPPIPTDAARPAAAPTRIVYDRRLVRAPDRPAGMDRPNEHARVMADGDAHIIYDERHIRD